MMFQLVKMSHQIRLIKKFGEIKTFDFKVKSHVEIGEKKKIGF